ncbi:hypothetical protein BXZ70DRAFT_868272, partial [Cristinia sonorae]
VKSAKLPMPEKYKGQDDIEYFRTWLTSVVRHMKLIGLTGTELDEGRVLLLGISFGGEASEWYSQVVEASNRLLNHWTFFEVVHALYNRFIHISSFQVAYTRFCTV